MNRLFRPLAVGFKIGVALRGAAYRRGWFKTRRLNRPVVSVGNLTVGGAGKTPLIMFVAERLLKRGWKPGILTRGYGRRHGSDLVCIEPSHGRTPDPREVGDEPALLARALPDVPIVVGADRYRAGCLSEERFRVDVHLLDDGFQHWGLARDVDVVAIDVTQELSDEALLPAGRQREPCSALARAHLVVLTRTELGEAQTIANRVRRASPQVRVFLSRTVFCDLIEASSGRRLTDEEVRGKPVGAFCGIGNPGAFFGDLRQWGFSVVTETAFADHHVYNPGDLRALAARARAAGASALLTTEKDALNLPEGWSCDIPVVACAVRTEIHEEDIFEDSLLTRLEAVRAGH